MEGFIYDMRADEGSNYTRWRFQHIEERAQYNLSQLSEKELQQKFELNKEWLKQRSVEVEADRRKTNQN